MFLEKSALLLFASRLKNISRFEKYPDVVQAEQLKKLLHTAKNTVWGKQYDFASIKSYRDYSSRLPVQDYEDTKPLIHRMMEGEKDVLWPGIIKWYAKSSGTTNDKSKFIPVSPVCLQKCHYRGAKDTVSIYLSNHPESKMFSGKGLILGGSHKATAYNHHTNAGDLSAVLIENINPVANLFRVPSKDIILMDEWETKLEAICNSTIHENITNLSGVPSWFLVLIKKVLAKTGKQFLNEVWPNLEVFFHGGVSFTPYREQYESIIPSGNMHYMETYNASEGFFALQNDPQDPAMLLLLDYEVFYEFIPIEDIDSDNPRVLPLEEIEVGRNYAILISSSNGLWRYKIGDTVKFTSTSPYKIIITGRTRHFINAFGEELMIDNTDKALHQVCKETGAKIREYTVAPVYMSTNSKGRHQWLIEFEQEPASIEDFNRLLDQALQELNSDYEAKRYKNITLDIPEIVVARNGLFYSWLEMKGKLGGQHKIPRLSNSRECIDSLLAMNH